jgi:hypothetical protein
LQQAPTSMIPGNINDQYLLLGDSVHEQLIFLVFYIRFLSISDSVIRRYDSVLVLSGIPFHAVA